MGERGEASRCVAKRCEAWRRFPALSTKACAGVSALLIVKGKRWESVARRGGATRCEAMRHVALRCAARRRFPGLGHVGLFRVEVPD